MTDEKQQPQAPEEGEVQLPDYFMMKIITIFLGVILIGCAITFFILLALKGTGNDEPVVAVEENLLPAAHTAAKPGTLALDAGEVITHMAVSEKLLAVHVSGPNGQRILLIDPYTADHKNVITVETATN
jgi:hypothetical protein